MLEQPWPPPFTRPSPASVRGGKSHTQASRASVDKFPDPHPAPLPAGEGFKSRRVARHVSTDRCRPNRLAHRNLDRSRPIAVHALLIGMHASLIAVHAPLIGMLPL